VAGVGRGDIIRHVLYQPSRVMPDGRALLVLSPLDFLAALARLIPPPRVHRQRYHGVLAPNAGLRERVTALATGPAADTPVTSRQGRPGDDALATPEQSAARSRWARLLARIYEVSPLACADCGAEMRILAFLTDSFTVVGILRHLGLPATAPPLTPARSPPRDGPPCDADPLLDLDQTPAFDPAEPDPIPDYDFDQTWARLRAEPRPARAPDPRPDRHLPPATAVPAAATRTPRSSVTGQATHARPPHPRQLH
jgi:hypothetical protein